MSDRDDAPEIGHDALDRIAPPPHWTELLPARHAAIGLRASPAPSLTFILLGVILGPQGLGFLSTDTLVHLDALVSVALAALGIFIGLGILSIRRPDHSTMVIAAVAEVILTVLIVSGVMYVLLNRWNVPLSHDSLFFSFAVGICSCASAATRVSEGGTSRAARLARIVDLGDVPLVVLGAGAVAAAAGRPLIATVALAGTGAIMVGLAGWLLFDRAEGDAERGVFVLGAVVLLGGVGAHSGSSPLLCGCIAALLWVRTPGAADRIIAADLRKLQHPLVALLLIIAGASIRWEYRLLWIAVPLVLLRLTGKLLASTVAARLIALPPGALATVLVPPGVVGVALALNIQQVLNSHDTLLLSGVTVASAVSEIVSMGLVADAEDTQ